MCKQISSLQNPRIKQVIQLKEKSRLRKKAGLFTIEGKRELSLAIKGNYTIITVFFYADLFSVSEAKSLGNHNIEIIEITKDVYQRIAYRETTEGVIAIAKSKSFSLNTIKLKTSTPLILVAEAPEKPGNIGALLRTADAANVDAVIIANPKTDLYNPNIVRASVGCIFTNTIAVDTTEEIIAFLKDNSIPIYCAALQASKPYYNTNFRESAAVVVGNEAKGLTPIWLKHATHNICIPMQGEIDSLNVSVAAGILIFEAKRQRLFK